MPFIHSESAKIYFFVAGSGKPLLILHGGPGVDHIYMLTLKSLSRYYRLIYIDQRGSGKSTIKSYDTLKLENFVLDLENLRQRLGINKWIILGHSFGGFVALEYAIHHQEHVSHLILIDTGFNSSQVQEKAPETLIEWGYSKSSSAWASRFFNGEVKSLKIPYAFLKFGRAYFYRLNLRLIIKSLKGKHNFQTTIEWFRKHFRGWDVSNILETIYVTTLIVAGEKDFQFPPEYQEEFSRKIRGSHLRIIKHAGHNTPIERPDELERIILSFLNGQV